MHQADVEFGERLGELLVRFQRVLQFQSFSFFDERAYPIHLLPVAARGAHARAHFLAPRIAHQLGDDGRASRRQFVDHRHVQIGVVAHRQCARNRRGTHH